ncbi:MAG: mechanosensitive ion channel family protein [Thaumarchaeota archaeon]|nr:mechanosensitive ion channel family protein [Nitrososphaerota archaeon]
MQSDVELVNEFVVAALIVAVAGIVTAAAYFVFTRFLSRARLRQDIRESILLVVKGPIVTAALGYGLVLAVGYVDSLNPPAVPYFAKPVNVTLLVQLVVLAMSVRTAGSIVKRLLPSVTEIRGADRLLVYGIYTLGIVALSYIVLSSPISPGVTASVWSTINFLTGLFATYLVVYITNLVIKRYSQAMEGRELQLQTTLSFVRRLVLAVIVLIGVSATTFSSFPAASGLVASLFIAAGFSSIVVGLAAQSSLSNIVAGMVVSTAQPFKIGDAVVFKNEFCFVEDIKLVITVLRTWDNRRLMVPNQLFLSEVVTNYTAVDPTMLAPVFVQITYESDLDKAIEILTTVARKHPDFMPIGNLPVVHVMEYTESGVNLRVLSRAKNQPTAFQMGKDILYQIRKEFQASGIELAYPRRRVQLDSDLKGLLAEVLKKAEGS